jgi:uncharacterized ion transporter superfamily protein YfcC
MNRGELKRSVILPWLVIGFNIVWMIWEVQSQNWTMEAILQAFSRLIVVLLFAEIIVRIWKKLSVGTHYTQLGVGKLSKQRERWSNVLHQRTP